MSSRRVIGIQGAANLLNTMDTKIYELLAQGMLEAAQTEYGTDGVTEESVFRYLDSLREKEKRMGEMAVMSVVAAAQKMNTTQEEVKRLMKSGVLEVIEREGGLPGVSERSVLDFIGEKRGDVPEKKPGRKPNLMSIEDACFYLDIEEEELLRLAESGEIEFYDDLNVKEKTVKMYKKKMDGREERVAPKTEKEDPVDSEENDTKELEREADRKDAEMSGKEGEKIEETGEKTDAKEKTFNMGKDGDEFDIDTIMKALFPGMKPMNKEKREEALKKHRASRRFTKREMLEVAEWAYMKGRLAVYDGLQTFERRKV